MIVAIKEYVITEYVSVIKDLADLVVVMLFVKITALPKLLIK